MRGANNRGSCAMKMHIINSSTGLLQVRSHPSAACQLARGLLCVGLHNDNRVLFRCTLVCGFVSCDVVVGEMWFIHEEYAPNTNKCSCAIASQLGNLPFGDQVTATVMWITGPHLLIVDCCCGCDIRHGWYGNQVLQGTGSIKH